MRRQFNILCTLGILFVLAACNAFSPTPIVERCLECVGGLTISLDGTEPRDYELNLTFPDGTETGVRCVDGQAEESWVYGMQNNDYNKIGCFKGHYFYTPSSFTVTLTWDDGQIVQHYEPTYYEGWCGELCCECAEYGGITVTIPISP